MRSRIIIKTIDKKTSILKRLNHDDNLSDIRIELESNNVINDMLVFSKEMNENKFIEIERVDEENFKLKEIITNNTLYLKQFNWELLNKKYKLDYGCNMGFGGIKKATKRAFKMNDCKLIEINAYKKDHLEFESKEDWIKKTNLFFNNNHEIVNFINSELLIGNTLNINDEIESTYRYTEIGKAKLNLGNLELTEEFKTDIMNAIKSKDSKKFKEIIKEYGQFIPTEIILGGRAYYKDIEMISEIPADKFKESSTTLSSSSFKIEIESNSSKKKTNFHYPRLLGGCHPTDKEFDEKVWIRSLNSYPNWECIEYKNPISIFQLLPDDLRKEAYESIGKKILYTEIKDYDYKLYEPGMYGTVELSDDIPRNVEEIIKTKEADYDIFATVANADKNLKGVFFNCQILKKQKAKPSIIIHGIQKKFRPRVYKLKISLMIVAYDTQFNFTLSDIASVELIKVDYESKIQREFDSIKLQRELGSMILSGIPFFGIPVLNNFDSSNNSIIIGHNFSDNQSVNISSYSVKNNCYSKLPNFTFYIIIISNYPNSNTYTSHPFNYKILKNPYIHLQSSQSIIPKYISAYLSKDDDDKFRPIFLKQDREQIKIKYVECRCNQTCFVCQNKTLRISKNEKNVDCILFDPLTR
ncbi:hypothetical protein RclHR1_16150005 [Rhizophagus clarus]|uniref:MACPF domain-containing protein n=1 Tax=Rhizophagus clarus TaxID=94130 RepID=A0A2Z6QW72_9GLOM|nr:hypothetical protein RclHR1_16150005 [Rhizophagus clarus]GES72686.1 hypothetical protein GLOIN_2v1871092 [Rhizophagus clarus]